MAPTATLSRRQAFFSQHNLPLISTPPYQIYIYIYNETEPILRLPRGDGVNAVFEREEVQLKRGGEGLRQRDSALH